MTNVTFDLCAGDTSKDGRLLPTRRNREERRGQPARFLTYQMTILAGLIIAKTRN
jgi:hypothetical protein